MGLYVTLAGIALFTAAVFLDWLATDIEDTERVEGASVSGYETDSLILFVAYLGIGLAAALLYAMTRAHRRQHRGLTLTSMAVGIAATLLALSYLVDAPGISEGGRDLSRRSVSGSPCGDRIRRRIRPVRRLRSDAAGRGQRYVKAVVPTPVRRPLGIEDRGADVHPQGPPKQSPDSRDLHGLRRTSCHGNWSLRVRVPAPGASRCCPYSQPRRLKTVWRTRETTSMSSSANG